MRSVTRIASTAVKQGYFNLRELDIARLALATPAAARA